MQFAYNDFGQLIADYQSHSGAVNTGSTPKVQYGYANGSANTIRPTTLTYPNGRVISYDYSTAESIPDAVSRIDAIKDGATALAQYSYLGLGTFVITDYTEPDIKWILNDLSGTNDPDTGDIYSGFDRFGRVKDNRWYNYGSSADTDRIKYGYDRAGNRIWRQNTVATSLGKAFDEFYWYDGIHRLKDMQRGTLNAGKTGITPGTSTFAECWGLDTTGNWSNYRQDDNGDGSWDLIQNRANNPVNEITNITESTGPSWITPAYDAAGNMTTIPKPANPTTGYTGIYDAWNRLTAVKEGGDFVAGYQYDPAKRRTIQKSYTSGVLSETRVFYYTRPSKWQVIEERVGSSSSAERQFVWGLRYIDDLALRDRDTDGNGSIDERNYAMQDANWNVTASTNAGSTVQERYAYSAYGVPIFLDASFNSGGSSSYQWETLYAGYQLDLVVQYFLVRNRNYDPQLATWLQRDPAGLSAGVNLFEYVHSGPLSFVDPSGRAVACVGVGFMFVFAIGGGLSINKCWDTCGNSATILVPSARVGAQGSLGGTLSGYGWECLSQYIAATTWDFNWSIYLGIFGGTVEVDEGGLEGGGGGIGLGAGVSGGWNPTMVLSSDLSHECPCCAPAPPPPRPEPPAPPINIRQLCINFCLRTLPLNATVQDVRDCTDDCVDELTLF